MKRKALIILAPQELSGVATDGKSVKAFLYTNLGGAWNKHDDIEIMDYPTSREVMQFLRGTFADYTFIYYAGHGYYDRKLGCRRLCINDREDMPTTMLKPWTDKRLLIADSCATLLEDFEKGDVIGESFYDVGPLKSINSRKYFDYLLSKSSNGSVNIYSADINQGAGEDSLGGFFTRSLLESAACIDDYYNGKKITVLNILYAFQLARRQIRAYDPIQTPVIYHSDGMRYFFPFAIKVNY